MNRPTFFALALAVLSAAVLSSCSITTAIPSRSAIPGMPRVGGVTTSTFLHRWDVESDIRSAATVGGVSCIRGVFIYRKRHGLKMWNTVTVAGE